MMSLLFFMVKRAHLKKIELILCYCMINFFFLYLNFIFFKSWDDPAFCLCIQGDDPNLSIGDVMSWVILFVAGLLKSFGPLALNTHTVLHA